MAGTADVISPLPSQGTKIFVLPVPTTPFADCTAAYPALSAGKQVLCPQSIGDLTRTRGVTEYKCMSSNASLKVMGAISSGNLSFGMLFDPTDTNGQKDLIDAFEGNTPLMIGIEFPNKPAGSGGGSGGHGTFKYFKAYISEESIPIEMDAAILYNVTVEVFGEIVTCAALADS